MNKNSKLVGTMAYCLGVIILLDILIKNQDIYPDILGWMMRPVIVVVYIPFIPSLAIIVWLLIGILLTAFGIFLFIRPDGDENE